MTSFECIKIYFGQTVDADILRHLAGVKNVSTYIKALIRYDIQHRIVPGLPAAELKITRPRAGGKEYIRKSVGLSGDTDADILARLAETPAPSAYVKILIRLNMEQGFVEAAALRKRGALRPGTVRRALTLDTDADADVLARLAEVDDQTGYICGLIREDIKVRPLNGISIKNIIKSVDK